MPDYLGMAVLLAAPLWTAFLGRRLIEFYERRRLVKVNYRGEAVSPALGPALLLGYLTAAAAVLWWGGWGGGGEGGGSPPPAAALPFLLTGFAFLGLWDDLMNDTTSGFKGHFGAGKRGRLTGGLLKVVVALQVSFLFAGALPFTPWRRLAALPLILLSANGINLFDRRPGRALKLFFTGALLIIFLAGRCAGAAAELLLPLVVPALALAPMDLEASGMLGDCGANLLGAALGACAVLYLPLPAQGALLLFWAALHLFCEYYSLSRVIEGNTLLRRLDYLGCRRARKALRPPLWSIPIPTGPLPTGGEQPVFLEENPEEVENVSKGGLSRQDDPPPHRPGRRR